MLDITLSTKSADISCLEPAKGHANILTVLS